MMERWNGGIMDRRNMTPNPKSENHGTAENDSKNPKRWNRGKEQRRKSPEILKYGMMENPPISQEEVEEVIKGTGLRDLLPV